MQAQRSAEFDATTQKPTGELRGKRRKRVLMAALVCDANGQQIQDCTLRDISESGARVGFARMTRPMEKLYVINVRERTAHEAVLAWHNGLEAGLAFTSSMPLTEITDPALGFLKKLWLDRATR